MCFAVQLLYLMHVTTFERFLLIIHHMLHRHHQQYSTLPPWGGIIADVTSWLLCGVSRTQHVLNYGNPVTFISGEPGAVWCSEPTIAAARHPRLQTNAPNWVSRRARWNNGEGDNEWHDFNAPPGIVCATDVPTSGRTSRVVPDLVQVRYI